MKFTAEPGPKHLPRSYSVGYLLRLANRMRRVESMKNHREIYFACKILQGHSDAVPRRFHLKRFSPRARLAPEIIH